MKVIGSRSRSQGQKSRKVLFSQCKTSIGNASGSIKHTAMKLACSLGFSVMVDRMVWLSSLSRDRKWPHVTKCTHLQVVGLRLESSLVSSIRRLPEFQPWWKQDGNCRTRPVIWDGHLQDQDQNCVYYYYNVDWSWQEETDCILAPEVRTNTYKTYEILEKKKQ